MSIIKQQYAIGRFCMNFYIVMMVLCVVSGNSFGNEQKELKLKCSAQETHTLFNLYCYGDSSWEEIESVHENNGISHDVELFKSRPLSLALRQNKSEIAHKLLDEKSVDVTYKAGQFEPTPLYSMMRALVTPKYYKPTSEHVVLMRKLVEKGCDINMLDDNEGITALDFYVRNGASEIYVVKDDGQYPPDFFVVEALIENGALLMIKDDEKRWNILDSVVNDFKGEDLNVLDKRTKMPLFATFKHDYKNYSKAFFSLSLIFKRFKKEGTIVMPRVLIDFMAHMVAPRPTTHIEETIGDCWATQKVYLGRVENYNPEFQELYKDIVRRVTPGSWADDWREYKAGNRSESNLVVQALNYTDPLDTKK
jgi:hypothetical protein